MINEKHLIPGRVLLRAFDHPTEKDKHGDPMPQWWPCMIIAIIKDTARRHAKKTATAEGWELLVLWHGNATWRAIEQVRIWPHQTCWKLAP